LVRENLNRIAAAVPVWIALVTEWNSKSLRTPQIQLISNLYSHTIHELIVQHYDGVLSKQLKVKKEDYTTILEATRSAVNNEVKVKVLQTKLAEEKKKNKKKAEGDEEEK
jgi:hypothetical protein